MIYANSRYTGVVEGSARVLDYSEPYDISKDLRHICMTEFVRFKHNVSVGHNMRRKIKPESDAYPRKRRTKPVSWWPL